jgi:acyl-CoA synthetase (AMP-forming)/AMP-acid ligase II
LYVVPDILAASAQGYPMRPAVTDSGGDVTYGQLWETTRSRAVQLAAAGVEHGDRVAILLPQGVDALACFFGAHLLGAVAVFIDHRLKSPQVSHLLSDSGARAVCTGTRFLSLLPPQWPPAAVLSTSLPLPSAPEAPAAVPVIGRHLAALMYTSGSTGPAKGVMITHANLLCGARIVADYVGLTMQDRTLAILPWSFDYGLNQVLATFLVGGRLVIQNSRFAPDICRALEHHRVTGLAGVPPLWELLTRRPSPFLRIKLPHLRYLTNSGGTLSQRTITAVQGSHPHLEIYPMYGLTEAFRSTYLGPAQLAARPTSIGKAIPDTEILVLNSAGQPCAPGEVGELVHSGPTVASGYWRDPEATARVFRPHPLAPPGGIPQTVVYSGDYVRADAEGFLYYVGRRDQMFKSLGIRTNPSEIEAAMLASGLVSEVVVQAGQAENGETWIAAAVVPPDGRADGESSAAQIRAYCDTELPPHLRPHDYAVVPDLPRMTSGKADRGAVRDLLRTIRNPGSASPDRQ